MLHLPYATKGRVTVQSTKVLFRNEGKCGWAKTIYLYIQLRVDLLLVNSLRGLRSFYSRNKYWLEMVFQLINLQKSEAQNVLGRPTTENYMVPFHPSNIPAPGAQCKITIHQDYIVSFRENVNSNRSRSQMFYLCR